MKYLLCVLSLVIPSSLLAYENVVFPEDAVVNVKTAFGAKGDGVTDDTEALKKALDEVRMSTIYFPNGTYLISDSIGHFDAKPHGRKRFMNLQGQSRDGVIIRLRDNTPGFTDADTPKIVVSTYHGKSTNDAMSTNVRDLTIDVGSGNAGAVALRYMTNNYGSCARVTLKSSDPEGAGFIGLDMRQSQNGPGLVQHIFIDGFDYGIQSENTFSLVYEHIKMRNQRVLGYRNNRSRVTMRAIDFEGTVPFLENVKSAQMTLIEAKLVGQGNAKSVPAITVNNGKITLRDIQQTGFDATLVWPAKNGRIEGPIREWSGHTPVTLFEQKPASLRLPIRETPVVPWETDQSKWIAAPETGDITAELQRRIDEGVAQKKTTLYFPKTAKDPLISAPIRIHGTIRRIIGMNAVIKVKDKTGAFEKGQAVFTFSNIKAPVIQVERFFAIARKVPPSVHIFDNQSRAAVVLSNMNCRATVKKPAPGKTWYLEDFCPYRQNTFTVAKGEKVWARQFNPESPKAVMVHANGGFMWILGLKTEGRATHVLAENGAEVEVLGGVSYQSWGGQPLNPPMFICKDARLSVSAGIYHHKLPFDTVIQETYRGTTKTLVRQDLPGHIGLFRSAK